MRIDWYIIYNSIGRTQNIPENVCSFGIEMDPQINVPTKNVLV